MTGDQTMLGRKNRTWDDVDHARSAVAEQLAAYKALVRANARATPDTTVHPELDDVEWLYVNTMILVLDRHVVHRLRMVTAIVSPAVVATVVIRATLIINMLHG